MALQHQYRPVNPRLGTHYATFTSAMVALVLVLAMLEQLGVRKLWLSHAMIAAPLIGYAAVAAMTRTLDLHEFFSAGRRVPAVFGGLSLAVTAIGGTGFFALTGCLYLIGFDALALVLGWAGGFAVCAVAFTPFLRKAGAYTLPGFFRQRFDSPLLGALAALALLPPAILILAAEIRIGAFIASLFVAAPFHVAVAIAAALVAVIAALGGMRSLSWTQCILYIVVIGAFLVPLTILSLQITNLPLPQLTYGGLFEELSVHELAAGAIQTAPAPLETALPGERPESAMTPFVEPFAALSRSDFLMLAFCFMAGTAAMPALLMRAGTAPSVFESRRAIAWGGLFFGLFLISAPAYAAFAKHLAFQEMAGGLPSQLPDWTGGLHDAGLADFADRDGDGRIGAAEMLISRDGVTLALPIMAGYPFVLAVLIATGGLSAALAAGAGHALAAGTAVGEDLFRGLFHPSATPGRRLFVSRLAILAVVAAAAWYVSAADFDILPAVAWAMSLAASAFLPALALSIWWPRMNERGALAAVAAGFAVAAAHILFADAGGWFGVSSFLAAVFGVPAGAAAGAAASLLTAAPAPRIAAMGEEIRDPGGEAVHDRAARLAPAAEAGGEAAEAG